MLTENEDFYWENGFMVFTREYHLKRGTCCKNKCRHCPWNFGRNRTKVVKSALKNETGTGDPE
ncbi:MAG TPA: DUF5522 domain-containing protein [Sphingobacteriaceae bacterium]